MTTLPTPKRYCLDAQGRLLIPAAMREELGFRPGEELHLRVVDGELHVITVRRSIARTRGIVRRKLGIPEDRSIVDEFIAERRQEAARE